MCLVPEGPSSSRLPSPARASVGTASVGRPVGPPVGPNGSGVEPAEPLGAPLGVDGDGAGDPDADAVGEDGAGPAGTGGAEEVCRTGVTGVLSARGPIVGAAVAEAAATGMGWAEPSGLGSGGLAPTLDTPGCRPTLCCSLTSQVVATLIPTTVDIAIAAPENRKPGSLNRAPTGFGRLCRPYPTPARAVTLSSRRTTRPPPGPGYASAFAGQGNETTSGGPSLRSPGTKRIGDMECRAASDN
ncbi:hypothetical protein GCM10010193_60180 [Kitasatospora atroaurantiaca]